MTTQHLWNQAKSLGYAVTLQVRDPFEPTQYRCTIFGLGTPKGTTVPCFQADSGWWDTKTDAIRCAISEVESCRAAADVRTGVDLPAKPGPVKLTGSADDILKSLGLAS